MSRTVLSNHNGKSFLLAAVITLLSLNSVSANTTPPRDVTANLTTHQTRYYIIHSDLDLDMVREAATRMTAMALEYHRRTKGFAGTIRRRLPFYLFSNPADYYAAGGIPGSIGVYNRRSLMALASRRGTGRLWHTIRHEGFHQFADHVIGGKLPVWIDEGLAEYFAEGIWTGDNYVTGVIPPARLRRIKAMIDSKQVRPFLEMLMMDRLTWNTEMQNRNYDQAWSMVHFLVNGQSGQYQKAFSDFINDISASRPWKVAFIRRFGSDVKVFENLYRRWWTSLEENPTGEKYVLAIVQTLTGYLGRAHSQRQRFPDVEAFFRSAREGRLGADRRDWLPPSLLTEAIKQAKKSGKWSILMERTSPRLVLTRPDGVTFTGTFTLQNSQVRKVEVTITPPQAKPTDSRPVDRRTDK